MRIAFAVGLMFTFACSSSSTFTKFGGNDAGSSSDGSPSAIDATGSDATGATVTDATLVESGDETDGSAANAGPVDATLEAEAAVGAGKDAGGVVVTNTGCALPPAGVFLVHYVPGSGNTCGPIPDSLLNGADVGSASLCPGGNGTIIDTAIAAGGCSVVADVAGCHIVNNTGSYTDSFIEQTTWTADYSSASGIASLTVATGNQMCAGTYTVTFSRVGSDGGSGTISEGGRPDSAGVLSDSASPTDAAACLPASSDCTSAPNSCCSAICVGPANAMEHSFCAAPCTAPAQCGSGCCTTLSNTGQMACAPIGFCANTCRGAGAACNSAYDCCAGHTCVTTNGGTCAFICTLNTDCVSGCCAPLSNSTVKVCSAIQFCTD